MSQVAESTSAAQAPPSITHDGATTQKGSAELIDPVGGAGPGGVPKTKLISPAKLSGTSKQVITRQGRKLTTPASTGQGRPFGTLQQTSISREGEKIISQLNRHEAITSVVSVQSTYGMSRAVQSEHNGH